MGRLFPALWPLVGVLSFALLVACGTVEAVQEGSPQEDALISIYAPQPDQTLKPIQEESVASLLDLAVGGELPVDAPSAFNVSQIASIPLAGQSKATNLNTLARTVVSQQASLAQQAEGAVPAQPKSVVFAQAAPQPVPVPAPAKMSGATKIANEGDDVPFEGAFNDAGVLDTHSIRWNFGDGTEKLNVLDPTHVYKDNGTYKVTLDVTDKDGDVGSANIDVVVNNLPPSAGLGPAKLVAEGVLTTFNSAVTDPGAADTHSFLWDFGAGEDSPWTAAAR
jgi:hypothetical protein